MNTYIKKWKFEKEEKLKYQDNMYNATFNVDSVKLANDAYQYTVSALTINLEDLQKLNDSLYKDLSIHKLKLKNISSTTRVTSTIQTVIDTLMITDTVFVKDSGNVYRYNARYSDEWLNLDEVITLQPYPVPPLITNVRISTDAGLTLADEKIYRRKRWWQFWRKKKLQYHNIHISSKNPYLHIDKIESYTIDE
jgi:hypothetical protein